MKISKRQRKELISFLKSEQADGMSKRRESINKKNKFHKNVSI
jgi:hypothetical protein